METFTAITQRKSCDLRSYESYTRKYIDRWLAANVWA